MLLGFCDERREITESGSRECARTTCSGGCRDQFLKEVRGNGIVMVEPCLQRLSFESAARASEKGRDVRQSRINGRVSEQRIVIAGSGKSSVPRRRCGGDGGDGGTVAPAPSPAPAPVHVCLGVIGGGRYRRARGVARWSRRIRCRGAAAMRPWRAAEIGGWRSLFVRRSSVRGELSAGGAIRAA
jgi:hypothetical protein